MGGDATPGGGTAQEAQPAKTTLFAGGLQSDVRRNHFL
jgi:hypothetical protein